MPPIPPDINLIEILFATGEVSIAEVRAICEDERQLWALIDAQVHKGHAEVWVDAPNGARKLETWEIATLVRDRAASTGEFEHPDAALRIRRDPNIDRAYRTDFAEWYRRNVE